MFCANMYSSCLPIQVAGIGQVCKKFGLELANSKCSVLYCVLGVGSLLAINVGIDYPTIVVVF
jgi:hypothetical protein